MLIESISGVRGTIEDGLTAEIVRDYAGAFHRFCPDGGIVIGRDSRPSGKEFVSDITDRLKKLGRSVEDCGIVPTPTVQYTVEAGDAVGGIVVTASHNPSEWNGLKFVGRDGCFLNGEEVEELMSLKGADLKASEISGERIEDGSAIDRHIAKICDVGWIDLKAIRNRCFRVAVDAVNGAAAEGLPKLLSAFGCEVVAINCEPTGDFVRGTEPLPENLGELSRVVREESCHVGLAADPDGDRLAIVDENGRAIGEEYTLVLAVDSFLHSADSSAPVVTNLSTTLAVERVAGARDIQVLRSAVGEINVVEMMKANGSLIGGEGNGGVILAENHFGRDSLAAAALVLNRMAQSTEPISGWFSELPQFRMVKDRIELGDTDSDELFSKAEDIFFDADIDRQDGLKFTWDDRWIHLRTSNTEPILRIYAEGRTFEEARELVDKIQNN